MTPQYRLYRSCRREAATFGGLPLWLAFRCLPALLVAGLMLLLLAASPSRAQAPNPLNELESGQLLLRAAGQPFVPAIIQASKVHFDISGMLATVRLQQTFHNDSAQYVEGVYAFPLPQDAAVRYMEMRIGERRIVGAVREKAEAKKLYQAAKQAGRKASLVEQQRPNLFTNRVANIAPGEAVTVELEYVQPVAYTAGVFSLRFPMTITPRYMPGVPLATDEEAPLALTPDPYLGWALPTDQVPDADAISPLLHPAPGGDHAPLNPIEISARLDMGMPLAAVDSPYHDIALARRAGVYDLRLAQGVSEMNRDFVLTWEPVTGSAPRAALFTEQVDGEHFGLLLVVPPSAPAATRPLPREIIFVVDTSGSMGGVSIEQARASLSRALAQLHPADRFNIIEFNSQQRSLFRSPVPASRHHVQAAQEFVRQLHASGGTEMLPALRAALAPALEADLQHDAVALRQVVFITDGAVGNEAALFEEIARLLGDTRLFTVGIGSAPNSWFMRKAAEFGRGAHTHIGDIDEVGQKMATLFEQLSRPAAVNLAVDWPQPVEAWPQRLPDLYHGQPLSVAVKFGAAIPAGEVRVSGDIGGQAWSRRLQISGAVGQGAHAGVASLWARRKIAGLLDQRVSGRAEEEVRAEVLPLALQHRLLSPYTSFIAVEEIVSRPEDEALHGKAVPNSRPHGQADQPFAWPRTATTARARAWFAALLLFLALLLRVLRQGEVDHVPAARA